MKGREVRMGSLLVGFLDLALRSIGLDAQDVVELCFFWHCKMFRMLDRLESFEVLLVEMWSDVV